MRGAILIGVKILFQLIGKKHQFHHDKNKNAFQKNDNP